MHLSDVLTGLRRNPDFMSAVVAWERFAPRQGAAVPLPSSMTPAIRESLAARKIHTLFRHQSMALDAIAAGANVIVATATASGKSLCYTLPVFERLLAKPTARALYLFPTKALAHDQLAETNALLSQGKLPIEVHSYDGDTPQGQRQKVRRSNGILVTNPDMLHAGILPFHPGWRDLFRNLEFVILDEIHSYRGIFGSHVANVIRRLRRICQFYGSNPQFICCSATIANPQEHAERLIELPFTLVDESENGAPRGAKHFILYNPPIIDETLGLRSSTILAAKDAALTFLNANVQTIVFARARQTVELLLTYLQDELHYLNRQEIRVAGYRGGYLPLERREIEHGLRDATVRGVVATNALELGIDIGALDAAVLTGYPGTVASTWQQAGRAGRRVDESVAIMIAGNSPLEQYICAHPRYLFGRSAEHALSNPDNLRIMIKHLLCAAYELPFTEEEHFGGYGPAQEILDILVEEGLLHETRQQYHWLGEGAPSSKVSLRTSGSETVVIQDVGRQTPEVIGEVDLESVPLLVYEGAIYLHQADAYLVETLDWEGRIANVRPVDVDYYTRSSIGSQIRRLAPEAERESNGLAVAHGEVTVTTQATSYRKIKRYTHETLGYGTIELPEITLETTGYWLVFSQALTEELWERGLLLRPNSYGPNWSEQRQKALDRDGHTCRTCGVSGSILHVHHVRPFREYGYIPGQNENYLQANHFDNLITLCPSCHRRAEAGQQARSALGGLAYALRNLSPLFLMCDPSDIQVSAESVNPVTKAATVVIYERVAAGVGLSERLYQLHDELLLAALELVQDCRCRDGCPACVGPPGEIGPQTKVATREMLRLLIEPEAQDKRRDDGT